MAHFARILISIKGLQDHDRVETIERTKRGPLTPLEKEYFSNGHGNGNTETMERNKTVGIAVYAWWLIVFLPQCKSEAQEYNEGRCRIDILTKYRADGILTYEELINGKNGATLRSVDTAKETGGTRVQIFSTQSIQFHTASEAVYLITIGDYKDFCVDGRSYTSMGGYIEALEDIRFRTISDLGPNKANMEGATSGFLVILFSDHPEAEVRVIIDRVDVFHREQDTRLNLERVGF